MIEQEVEITLTEASSPAQTVEFQITMMTVRKGHFPFSDGDVTAEIIGEQTGIGQKSGRVIRGVPVT